VIDTVFKYFEIGFCHVLPLGFDHILFILSIFFLNSNLKSVIIQCSVFTLAHSLTLALAAAGYMMPKASIVEPLIALSILFTSVENIIHSKVNAWRLLIIFVFGLIHGMGFANALIEIGIPDTAFWAALISFNMGVEMGQISIIILAYLLISKWFRNKSWYKERVVYPISCIIGNVALYWTVTRLL